MCHNFISSFRIFFFLSVNILFGERSFILIARELHRSKNLKYFSRISDILGSHYGQALPNYYESGVKTQSLYLF